MQKLLIWLLQRDGITVEKHRHLPLSAIRAVIYRLQMVIVNLGMVGGAVYNYLNGYHGVLIMDFAVGLVLALNTWRYVRGRPVFLGALAMLLVSFAVLVAEVLYGNPQFVYFCLIFPVAGYIAVEEGHLSSLNLLWWACGSVLSLLALPLSEAVVLIGCLACICIFLEWFFFILEHQQGELMYLASRDPLTDSLNRRAMEETLSDVAYLRKRYAQPASLVMIDIDYFKQINDSLGHGEGDNVLVTLAALLQSRLRETDRICRYGGEEFVLVLPNTHQREAFQMAQRLRKEIADAQLSSAAEAWVTVSCGVAEIKADETVREWLDRCDRALYLAKQDGRNCVEIAGLEAVA